MRASLFFNPRILVERLAVASLRQRRRQRLKGTPAAKLELGHLDSLELLELLRATPPRIIYDVGANVGTWSCLAKSVFPAARIEAFEPLSQHAAGFQTWTAPWKADVHFHHIALGAETGKADMVVTDFSDASSLLPLADAGRAEFHVEEARRESVPVETIDHLIAQGTIPTADLIKLDVQGFELEVLRGAEKCLTSTRHVLCEVSFRTFYERQALFSDVVEFLARRGFALHAFGHGVPVGAPLVQADALFVRTT